VASNGPHANHLHLAPDSWIMPAHHHSIFIVQMLFLTSINIQCQSNVKALKAKTTIKNHMEKIQHIILAKQNQIFTLFCLDESSRYVGLSLAGHSANVYLSEVLSSSDESTSESHDLSTSSTRQRTMFICSVGLCTQNQQRHFHFTVTITLQVLDHLLSLEYT